MYSSFYNELLKKLSEKIPDRYLLIAFINKYYYHITLDKNIDEKVSKYENLLNV